MSDHCVVCVVQMAIESRCLTTVLCVVQVAIESRCLTTVLCVYRWLGIKMSDHCVVCGTGG